MVTCAVVSCPNRTNPDRADNKKGVRFFNIPKLVVHQCSLTKSRTQRRRAAWIARINRKDLQDADVKPYHRVCSAHFVSGSPSKLWEETSPDWAPSINLGYSTIKAASSTSLARYNRVKRRNQDKLVLSQHQAQNHGQPMDIREDVEKEICNVPRTEEPAPVPDYHGQEDSASAGHNDAVIRLNSEPVTEGNLVSTEQKLAVKREVYESLRNELLELKQRFQQVRDRLTEVEVDKLELQTSLKSHYDESQCLKSELKKKEERMILRLKEKEVHIQANYENRLQESLKEIKKQKQCIAEADKLTFRNSEVFASNEKRFNSTQDCRHLLFSNQFLTLSPHTFQSCVQV